jgi:hypothetical protein
MVQDISLGLSKTDIGAMTSAFPAAYGEGVAWVIDSTWVGWQPMLLVAVCAVCLSWRSQRTASPRRLAKPVLRQDPAASILLGNHPSTNI